MGKQSDAVKLKKLIRERRIANGLTQLTLAGRLGIAQPTVSMWEQGRFSPSSEQIDRLEGILGGITETDQGEADSQTPISAWLSRAMAKKDITATEVARQAGVSVPTIYNLLSGRAENPQAKTIRAIESALGEKFDRIEPQEPALSGVGPLTDFDPYDKGQIPEKPGVYVFYDVSQRPIYVGKAKNIAIRIRDHSDKFWFKPPIVELAGYVEISDDKLRDQIETVLIQFLKKNAVINKNKTERD